MGLRATIQFLVLCIPGSLWSMGGDPSWPTAPLRFETILPENGASMRFIQQIYEDSQGFLWIGTQGALLRYDGLRFKVFKHRSNDPHSLSGNAIVAMIEDRHGKMWVATHLEDWTSMIGIMSPLYTSKTIPMNQKAWEGQNSTTCLSVKWAVFGCCLIINWTA